MKLLTLNTHSLIETDYPQKLALFVDTIAKECPDIIALQEVSQTADAPVAACSCLRSYVPVSAAALIRADNHVYNAVRMLADRGVQYSWTWLPIKRGYDRYDEGIALMSRSPIFETHELLVSSVNDYSNWKTRRLLGIRTAAAPLEWFYSVHYGWWDDADEPFAEQWKRTQRHMLHHENVWLMGDLNNAAQVRGEGYDLILHSGWHDSYLLAERRDGGVTVSGRIDGWQDRASAAAGMRIDHIWCRHRTEVYTSCVVFNGIHSPIVSDHYGVMIEAKEMSPPNERSRT